MVLNWALLLPAAAVADFRGRIERANAEQNPGGLAFEVSGPWPPYSFCPVLETEAGRKGPQWRSRTMSGDHADAKGDDSLYEMLLNAIPSSVLLVGRDLRITLANRNFLERSRRTKEETLDRRLPEVFPPAILDHTEIVRRIQSVFDTNKPTTGERITYRAPGGLMRIYYYRVLPLPDRDNVEFAILVMEDVTERERLSEDIRRMERHLRIVVESTSEIILSTDTGGRILSWNQSAEQISGYTPQEVEGKHFWEFCAPEHQAGVRRLFSERAKRAKPRSGRNGIW